MIAWPRRKHDAFDKPRSNLNQNTKMNTTINASATSSKPAKWTKSARLGAPLSSSIEARKARVNAAFAAAGLAGTPFKVSYESSHLPDSATAIIVGEVLSGLRVLVSYTTIVAFRAGDRAAALPLNKFSRTTDRAVRDFCGRASTVTTYGEDAFAEALTAAVTESLGKPVVA